MPRNFHVIQSILSEPWFLSLDKAADLGRIYFTGLFNPDRIDFEAKGEEASAAYVMQAGTGDATRADRVGVVNIMGPLHKYDSLCAYGMESYGQMIRAFDADPAVSAIVLNIDSPGGTVCGTEELGTIIKGASKPVIAFVSDFCASAAYWFATCCKEIIANNTTAIVGSIGVMSTITDLSGLYEKEGVKIHEILAPQSKDKNGDGRAALAGNYKPVQETLRVLADKFHATVRENRPAVTDDQLTGKTYFAQDVVGTLIDSIGTFESAVARACELADAKTESTPVGESAASAHNNQSQISMSKPKFTALASAAGVEAFESTDGSLSLTAEQAEAIEQALTNASTTSGHLTQAQTDLAAAQKENATLKSEKTALVAKVAELESKPGAQHSSVGQQADGHADADAPATSFAEAKKEAEAFFKSQNA